MTKRLSLVAAGCLAAAGTVHSAPGAHGLGLVQEAARAGRTRRLPSGTEIRLSSRGGTYEIRMPDGRTSGVRPARTTLALARGAFDPLGGGAPPLLLAEAGRVRIVQFETMVLPEQVRLLEDLGVEVHRPLPEQALIATVPAGAEGAVRALPGVRWLGPYAAEYRLQPALLADVLAGRVTGAATYCIQTLRRGPADKDAVARAVEELGGSVEPFSPEGFLLRATLDPGAVAAVAALDAVLWIEPALPIVPAMRLVRRDSGANTVEFRTGFTGQGVRGEVADIEVNENHPDFQSNPILLHGPKQGSGFHGTEVMGIVFGDGTRLKAARGLLPDGQPIFASAESVGPERYRYTRELVSPPYEGVFQTNSWGSGLSPAGYPSAAFQLDDLIFLYDLHLLQGMGNSGDRVGLSEAWAKNVLSVGGIRHFDTLTTADDRWSGAGSIGPGEDGRIKPDVCYWYDKILTTSGSAYNEFSGTSAATPQVAGVSGLFFQMWSEELFGNVAPGSSVFEGRPHSSTSRAMLLNTTNAYPFQGPSADLTRMHQGWGRPSAGNMLALGAGVLVVDEWRTLRLFESASYEVVVEPGAEHLHATLVYTDPPGTSSATQHRVNDLSLRVTAPDGTVYRGNAGLLEGNESVPGTEDDRVDTSEQVWLSDPAPGVWRVEVLASEILVDGHVETPEVDVDFGLVVGPVAPVATSVGASFPPSSGTGAELGFRGYLVPGSPGRLDLTGAAPGRAAFFLLGDSTLPLPLGSGLLVPRPGRILRATTDAAGNVSVDLPLPPGLGSGSLLYAQAWVLGGSTPAGSNTLELRVP